MIFYATSDEIAMIGILRCVSIGKATYYKKIELDLDIAEKALGSLIKKYNVAIGKATTSLEHPCAGHMVIQVNQTLLAKKKCMVYLLVTLPKEVRSQADFYRDLVVKLEVVDKPEYRSEDRKRIAVEWQKKYIRNSFISKTNPNPDEFRCLEWEKERLFIYAKDKVKKLVLRRSDYTPNQLKKQANLLAKKITEQDVEPRKLKPARWTWHVTNDYQKYIQRIAEQKILKAITDKKAQKRKDIEKHTKKSPTKNELGRLVKLSPQEVAHCVSDAEFLVRYMPAFSGTASDIGKMVSDLEWRFNAKEIKAAKAVRSKDGKAQKASLPITQAFKVKELAKRAGYNLSRFQFKYHSFAELQQAVETFKDGLGEIEKIEREERIANIYELEKRQITKELKQKNTEKAKFSADKIDTKIEESFAKKVWKLTGFRTTVPKRCEDKSKDSPNL